MRYSTLLLIGLLFTGVSSATAQDEFPVRHGLPVNNYGDTLQWPEFQEALLAVDSLNPLDVSLFNMIRGYADDGYCFGMCLLAGAVYVEDGYMGLCKPVESYAVSDTTVSSGQDTLTPFWPIFKHAYHVLWARQFSQPMVRLIAEYVANGNFVDPVNTFNLVESYLAGEEIPVVLISESLSVATGVPAMGGMHAVLAYKTEKNGTTWKIHVYDPSRPYIIHPDFYRTDSNVITINSTSNTWSYYGPAGAPIWNGFIYTIPGIRLLVPSTNPLLISNLSQTVAIIVVNGGKITGITSADTEKKPVIVPWGYAGDGLPHFYILSNVEDGQYQVEIESDEGYQLLIAGEGKVAEIKREANGHTVDLLTVNGLTSDKLAIDLSNGTSGTYSMTIHDVKSYQKINSFSVAGLALNEGENIIFASAGSGTEIYASRPIDVTIKTIIYKSGEKRENVFSDITLLPGNVLAINVQENNDVPFLAYKPWRGKLWVRR